MSTLKRWWPAEPEAPAARTSGEARSDTMRATASEVIVRRNHPERVVARSSVPRWGDGVGVVWGDLCINIKEVPGATRRPATVLSFWFDQRGLIE
jgi:hypothetical protein